MPTISLEYSALDLIPPWNRQSPTVKGNRLPREISRVLTIAKRIGVRLERFLDAAPEQVQLIRVIDGVAVPVRTLTDQPLMVPWLPDKEFRETLDRYFRVVSTLATEQREWAKHAPKAPSITDAEGRAELALLTEEAIRTMPRAELDQLLRERDAVDVASTTKDPA